MPSLDAFFKLTRTLELEWPEQELRIVLRYKQLGYTPEFSDQLEEEITREDGTKDPFRRMYGTLKRLVADWDLTGADGKPYPLDEASLSRLPTQILNQVYVAIHEDLAVNPLKRRPIESISAAADDGDASEMAPGPSGSPTALAAIP